ncbi:MAG: DUF2961 domain-containing protein [Planctomycetes bacterium]|nr:DUF2961 domain-containing protein [Planctomycetota bacterium]
MAIAVLLSAFPPAVAAQREPVDFGSLCREAVDLARLARSPDPAYRNVQWSSTDRRSLAGADSPDWFGNADGFGSEPVPGFAAVLRAPGADGVGLYLVGEHAGPGAIVRTWTAGMGGTLRVYLDGSAVPLFEGRAAEFLARRSHVLRPGGAADDPLRAFTQEDADHVPIPFASALRITWEGELRGLHFYHVQIRQYAPGTAVRTFTLDDLARCDADVRAAAERFASPAGGSREGTVRDETIRDGTVRDDVVELAADGRAELTGEAPGPSGGALVELTARVESPAPDAALRGVLLRIAFDGSRRPQVEAPLGDFFGAGPGINPFVSLPMTVARDGTMTCRFPMPFRRGYRIELEDHSGSASRIALRRTEAAWDFGPEALHFRARWRVDRGITAGGGARPIDLPYVMLRGAGRLVGVACMVVNPSGIPTPGGNWWGEGDEKVFVDDDVAPSILGTGSEDYFDYSWSRPRLFAHPYCGQPLDSGPGTSGFVADYRFQILDDVPFERFLAFAMELYTHRPLAGVDYARIAYCYARPGAFDDHVPPTPADLQLPTLPVRQPVADGGARGATLHDGWDLAPRVGSEPLPRIAEPLATRHVVVGGELRTGDVVEFDLPLAEPGAYDAQLVLVHRPDAATLRAAVDGHPLDDGAASLEPRSDHATRILSVPLSLPATSRPAAHIALQCVEPGFFGLDYVWVTLRHVVVPGMLEGEAMTVVDRSPDLAVEDQGLRGRWSGGRHLWVRARDVGDFVELSAVPPGPGRYRARLVLTQSGDYGTVRIWLQGRTVADAIDTFSRTLAPMAPLDCGELEVGDEPLRLRVEVVARSPGAADPGTFFGIDGLVLERR